MKPPKLIHQALLGSPATEVPKVFVAVWVIGRRQPLIGQLFEDWVAGQRFLSVRGVNMLGQMEALPELVNPASVSRLKYLTWEQAVGAAGAPSYQLESILKAVALHYKLTPEVLRIHNRRAAISQPRQVAMYLMRELTESSLQEIGDFFGGMDHGTVIYSAKKVASLISVHDAVERHVQAIRASLVPKEQAA